MEEELNYLSCKIEHLDGQINTLEINKKNYTTPVEINFYISQFKNMNQEKEILENILNAITIVTLNFTHEEKDV